MIAHKPINLKRWQWGQSVCHQRKSRPLGFVCLANVIFLVEVCASWHESSQMSQGMGNNNRQDNRFMPVKKLNIGQRYDLGLLSHPSRLCKGEFTVSQLETLITELVEGTKEGKQGL